MKVDLDMGEFKITLDGVNVSDGTFTSATYDRKDGSAPFELTGKEDHVKYGVIGAMNCLKDLATNLGNKF